MTEEVKTETLSEGVVNVVRGLVRPVVTVWLIISWTVTLINILQAGGTIADMPVEFTGFTAAAFVWWFGERSIKKAAGFLKNIKGG